MILKFNVFFSLVGKFTNCSKWWLLIISMNFPPLDGHNGELYLSILSGQTILPKMKSPRTWTEGG